MSLVVFPSPNHTLGSLEIKFSHKIPSLSYVGSHSPLLRYWRRLFLLAHARRSIPLSYTRTIRRPQRGPIAVVTPRRVFLFNPNFVFPSLVHPFLFCFST